MVSIYLLCWFSFVLAGSLFHDVISGHLGHDNCDHNPDTQNVLITLEWVNYFRCFLRGRCMSGRWKCVQAGKRIKKHWQRYGLFLKVSESWSFTLVLLTTWIPYPSLAKSVASNHAWSVSLIQVSVTTQIQIWAAMRYWWMRTSLFFNDWALRWQILRFPCKFFMNAGPCWVLIHRKVSRNWI